MYYPLRLNNKDQYIEDLNAIRKAVKENGNRDLCHSIVLSHSAESTITFHVNFALEQDLKKILKRNRLRSWDLPQQTITNFDLMTTKFRAIIRPKKFINWILMAPIEVLVILQHCHQ